MELRRAIGLIQASEGWNGATEGRDWADEIENSREYTIDEKGDDAEIEVEGRAAQNQS